MALEGAGGGMNMTKTYYMKLKKQNTLSFKNKNKEELGFLLALHSDQDHRPGSKPHPHPYSCWASSSVTIYHSVKLILSNFLALINVHALSLSVVNLLNHDRALSPYCRGNRKISSTLKLNTESWRDISVHKKPAAMTWRKGVRVRQQGQTPGMVAHTCKDGAGESDAGRERKVLGDSYQVSLDLLLMSQAREILSQ